MAAADRAMAAADRAVMAAADRAMAAADRAVMAVAEAVDAGFSGPRWRLYLSPSLRNGRRRPSLRSALARQKAAQESLLESVEQARTAREADNGD
jgi:hypothetical protein